jgi:hypothetical protein
MICHLHHDKSQGIFSLLNCLCMYVGDEELSDHSFLHWSWTGWVACLWTNGPYRLAPPGPELAAKHFPQDELLHKEAKEVDGRTRWQLNVLWDPYKAFDIHLHNNVCVTNFAKGPTLLFDALVLWMCSKVYTIPEWMAEVLRTQVNRYRRIVRSAVGGWRCH